MSKLVASVFAAITLAAIVVYLQSGDRQAAAGYARKLVALIPDDAQARALLQELQR